MKKVAILLTLFIFASIDSALCDPVKSVKGVEGQVTPVKLGKNKVVMQKKAAPAKKTAGWIKRNQTGSSDVDFLRTLEEKKRFQWVGSADKLISSLEFSETARRNSFVNPLRVKRIESSSDPAKSVLTSARDGNGSFEEGKFSATLRLLQSKEQTFKEIFMGFRFSFDLTSRHLFLEMNVAPATDTTSGVMIRF